MIVGTGVDMALVTRIEKVTKSFPERFAKRILAPTELDAWRNAPYPTRFLTKRFAAKEAGSKALGTAIRNGVSMRDFVVETGEYGKPLIRRSGLTRHYPLASVHHRRRRYRDCLRDSGETSMSYARKRQLLFTVLAVIIVLAWQPLRNSLSDAGVFFSVLAMIIGGYVGIERLIGKMPKDQTREK